MSINVALDEVKDIIRQTSGARDFIAKANRVGYCVLKEDWMGLQMRRGDDWLMLTVLPSYGPDTIWCLSVTPTGLDNVAHEANCVTPHSIRRNSMQHILML
jgi:hypothetical protein